MGGFVLEAPGHKEPIPLDAEQLFYLIKHNYVEYPSVTKRELDDRDKSDGLSRYVSRGGLVMEPSILILILGRRAPQIDRRVPGNMVYS
jgi:hypothetical protein